MPQLPAGSVVYPIETLIKSPDTMSSVLTAISSGSCKCMIVDTPFVATVENKGFIVEQVIGVGSIICSPGCARGEVVLHSSTWSYGRVVPGNSECIVAASKDFTSMLKSIGVHAFEVDYEEFFNLVLRRNSNGVMVLSDRINSLEIQRSNGRCGNLYSYNPLHPAGAVGKPGFTCCINEIYEIIGPRSKLLSHILAVDDKTIISQVRGMGEGLIVSFNIVSSTSYASLAAWLGVLYVCGSTAEHL
ncbi:MAG TPA: hypothetical protein EYH50_04060 [Pyrodictium delaneyi]|uniref:Uncharacterized protein n=1 Tax=Pyrodictium delaneyi TaxID=1273541 RepID=A0A832ZTY7_9CREN|nr:hypothetical protein [Pyrodictium delaneyi]